MRKLAIIFFVLLLAVFPLAKEKKVEKFSAGTYTIYQSNGIRVYFSEEFLKGFVETNDIAQYNKEFFQTIGPLLESGSLTGEMFLKEISDTTPGIINLSKDDISRFNEKDGVYESMKNFKGQVIKILYFEQKNEGAKSQNREYELWVTPSIEETGWGEFHMFKVILKVKPEGRVELMEFKYLGVQI